MSKTILMNDQARRAVLSGVEKLSNVVAVTMGPKGRNVIVGKFAGAPVITKDGVSVAREVVLDDHIEELGCQLVKEVSGRTADLVGDGTTTATVLAHEIFKNGERLVSGGHSLIDIRDGLDWAKEKICEKLDELSKPIESYEDLVNVASISANNDYKIGKVIADAFEMVGWTGTVAVEAAPGEDTSIRYIDGVELGSGMITPAFLSGEDSEECSFENCRIIIYDGEITHISDCLNLFNKLSKDNIPVLIISRDVKQEALATLVTNKKLGRLKCVCVNTPSSWRDRRMWLEDLSGIVGGKIFGSGGDTSLAHASLEDLGFAKKVVVSRSTTKILDGNSCKDYIKKRVELYNDDMSKLLGDLSRLDLKNRLAMLNSKAAVISVGYSTELELREKGDRIDDAMSATRAAITGGILPGGGAALLRAASLVDTSELSSSKQLAAKILIDACSRPVSQICINADENPGVICAGILSNDNMFYGYDASSGDFGDMYEMGIVDPKNVTKTALESATSISSLLITTDAVMAIDPESNNPSGWQPPAGWRPPSSNNLNHKY